MLRRAGLFGARATSQRTVLDVFAAGVTAWLFALALFQKALPSPERDNPNIPNTNGRYLPALRCSIGSSFADSEASRGFADSAFKYV